jgi:hypothetical protein
MPEECFRTLDLELLKQALTHIHEQVHGRHGRIEVTRDGCDDVCVLISKAELQSFEQALEILSATDTFKSMCDHITQVAAECGGSAVLPARA